MSIVVENSLNWLMVTRFYVLHTNNLIDYE